MFPVFTSNINQAMRTGASMTRRFGFEALTPWFPGLVSIRRGL